MSNRTAKRPRPRSAPSRSARERARQPPVGRRRSPDPRRRMSWMVWAAAAAAVVAVLFVVFSRASSSSTAAADTYSVGQPGPGQPAPGFTLPATTGGTVSLSQFRGRTVLLYFQEGITCQACWDQLVALDHSTAALRSAGVDQVVTITTDPVDLLAQKVRDEKINTPVLSDKTVGVSHVYHANSYGMMGTSRDGHSFVLVGPTGTIRWRADYGGAPKYTMYVAVPTLLRQLRAGEIPG
jgi:peroxiredoxin